MFTCAIETSYTDPTRLDEEMQRHKEAAEKKLGACYMSSADTTDAPELDAGIPTGITVHKLITRWQAGEKPGPLP